MITHTGDGVYVITTKQTFSQNANIVYVKQTNHFEAAEGRAGAKWPIETTEGRDR